MKMNSDDLEAIMEFSIENLANLKAQQGSYDTVEAKWNSLIKERNLLIKEWNETYENPINEVGRARGSLELAHDRGEIEDDEFQKQYGEFTIEHDRLINIRRNDPAAKKLRKEVDRAVKDAKKYLPTLIDAGVKFRLARRKFMIELLGREYF